MNKIKGSEVYAILSRGSKELCLLIGHVYIDETTRRLEQRVKEHQDACERGDEKVSAIAEHAHHPPGYNKQ